MLIQDDEEIRRIIAGRIGARIEDAEVSVAGGAGKFEATVVSERFTDLDTVARHQLVYAALERQIENGLVHALTIRAFTPAENQSPEKKSPEKKS